MYLGMCEAARELLPMPKARYFIHVSRHTHTHTHTQVVLAVSKKEWYQRWGRYEKKRCVYSN